MSALSLEQMRDVTARLNKLTEIGKVREAASAEHAAANQRWSLARYDYAVEHAQLVALYGEEYAPIWFESINGPRHIAPLPGGLSPCQHDPVPKVRCFACPVKGDGYCEQDCMAVQASAPRPDASPSQIIKELSSNGGQGREGV